MFKEYGFLSEDVRDLSSEIERQVPGLWVLTADVNSYSHKYQYRLEIQSSRIEQIMAATLLSRLLANYQALVLVTLRGMLDQGYVLLRVVIENLFHLAAIAEDNAFAKSYVDYEEHQRRKILDKLKKQKASLDPNDADVKIIEQKITEIKNNIASKLIKSYTTEEIAKIANFLTGTIQLTPTPVRMCIRLRDL